MVVSDTSPLNYLVLIDCVEILPKLYNDIWIPDAVRQELSHVAAPLQVRHFISQPPSWLHIKQVAADPRLLLPNLDDGEREAILLAHQMNAGAILIDERAGSAAAQEQGLKVIGTLGILDEAARHGYVDLRAAFVRLQQTSFRTPARIMKFLLEQHPL